MQGEDKGETGEGLLPAAEVGQLFPGFERRSHGVLDAGFVGVTFALALQVGHTAASERLLELLQLVLEPIQRLQELAVARPLEFRLLGGRVVGPSSLDLPPASLVLGFLRLIPLLVHLMQIQVFRDSF